VLNRYRGVIKKKEKESYETTVKFIVLA